ncbi:MAG: peptide chain release factor N(5)-glutamine methyltransferase [Deltaproteobacteria bacterium]|nr:peptide chain release factor N(5)-glutamine methyltransferase [Deltaproteobacteria bacterium]
MPASAGAVLQRATARLRRAGIDTARLDAEVLLAHASGMTRTRLMALDGAPLSDSALSAFEAGLVRRVRREPLAYVIGRQEFWSLDFEVTPAVLIPRPETERVVETALSLVSARIAEAGQAGSAAASATAVRVADAGTGSGCIAIALAHELPGAAVWATDASAAALVIARRNAVRLGVADHIQFARGDLLAPIAAAAPFDLICSNPPYVAEAQMGSLQPELSYEPAAALFAANDGLAVIRRLINQAPALLAPTGWLLVEIGCGQASEVSGLARAAGFAHVELRDDYAGIARVLVAGNRRPPTGERGGEG